MALGKRKRSSSAARYRKRRRFAVRRSFNVKRSMRRSGRLSYPFMRYVPIPDFAANGTGAWSVAAVNGLAQVSCDDNGFVYLASTFRLANLPNVSEFQNLFDAYRINLLIFEIAWLHTSSDANQSGVTPLTFLEAPYCYYVLDKDTPDPPTSLNQLAEYANGRRFYFGSGSRVLRIKVRPTAGLDSVQAGTSGAGTVLVRTMRGRPWIDMANVNVPHYSMRLMFAGGGNGANSQHRFSISCRAYIQCKTVR